MKPFRLDGRSKAMRQLLDKVKVAAVKVDPAATIAIQSGSITDWRDNPKQRKHQKYSNEVIETNDGRFDSKAEHRHWEHLKLLQRAKRIKDLQRQVVFELAPAVKINGRMRPALRYVADMVYFDLDLGRKVVSDVKGAVTPEFRIKRHLMMSVHGIEIQEIRA